jgi:hypothetical protein
MNEKLLRLTGWAAIILLSLALRPFLLHLLNRLADQLIGLCPHLSRLSEDLPWSY